MTSKPKETPPPPPRSLRMLPSSAWIPPLHPTKSGVPPEVSRARHLLAALLRIPWTPKPDGNVEVHSTCVLRQQSVNESADVKLLRGRVVAAGQRAVAFLVGLAKVEAKPSKLEGFVLVKAADWEKLQAAAAEVVRALEPSKES